MKIKVKHLPYSRVMALRRPERKKPMRPNIFFRILIRLLAIPDLLGACFSYTTERMELVGKDEPCLILMNHSSFIDMKAAYGIFFPRPMCIVTTSDAFVGLNWIMRLIGAIPTNKFVSDVGLIGDMQYALRQKKCSVLMYPEASYTFDGTATPLPRKLGVVLKKLKVPVVTVTTSGAFSREPLYNCLQKRKNVPVSARVRCLLTPEEIAEKSVDELDAMLDEVFTFDGFAWQRDNGIEIDSPTRADGLSRILFRCASCGAEGQMEGKGILLKCRHCGKTWEMDKLGQLRAISGATEFSHIPDWYSWQREEVRRQLEEGRYQLDIDVDIGMLVDTRAIYMVGSGRLRHDETGFTLTGCDGELHYTQPPQACYSLYADYYWYEIADVICIGTNEELYYCFPKNCGDVVAKTRMATEELYKLKRQRRRKAEQMTVDQ
ncbi:MAG: 1-acyl-sn-glycerol-3-phosphate acyltransferase [Oscillospiraceae bacterium]|nr:1-acyl-sn-glycerol-3-phosphate acyltransferase [Oscillospiraceae bacterium]